MRPPDRSGPPARWPWPSPPPPVPFVTVWRNSSPADPRSTAELRDILLGTLLKKGAGPAIPLNESILLTGARRLASAHDDRGRTDRPGRANRAQGRTAWTATRRSRWRPTARAVGRRSAPRDARVVA